MIIHQHEKTNRKKRHPFWQVRNMYILAKSLFRNGYLTLCILLMAASGFCFELAPLNPDFLNYGDATAREQLQTSDFGYPLGHIPGPVDLSHVDRIYHQSKALQDAQAVQLPAQYDLRTTGKLTSVKDQGQCGDCWAYATYSSLESYLMPAENWYFSEDDLNVNNGFDIGACNGGNAQMSMAYLSRYSGPIIEGGTAGQAQKHVQKVEYVPCTPYTFPEIKQAVMTYGAVDTSFYASTDMQKSTTGSYFTSSTNSYYYSGKSSPNHSVAIVGWNDNYSKSNFAKAPPGNGAFIIRNSWGTSWGDGGYFYMSYYDTYAGNDCWVFDDAESPTNYSTIYQYDPLGWVENYGFGNTTGWGANIFTATTTAQLEAVSFYASSLSTTYEIDIYTNVTAGNPVSGTHVTTQTGTLPNVGYETIVLSQPASLTKGMLFSVVVKFVTPGYNYPIPVQMPYPGYSSKAPHSPGESFASSNGQSWTDISQTSYIACIKAFAGAASTTPTPTPKPSPTPTPTPKPSPTPTTTPTPTPKPSPTPTPPTPTPKPSPTPTPPTPTPKPSPTPTPKPSPTPTPKLTITVSAGSGGSITPSGVVSVTYGTSAVFTIAPNTGYSLSGVTVDGSSLGNVPATGGILTFSDVTTSHTVSATFKQMPAVTITASAGSGGRVSPSGAVSVAYGANAAFSIVPNSGYSLSGVTVDGNSLGNVPATGGTLTFSDVTAAHVFSASFKKNS